MVNKRKWLLAVVVLGITAACGQGRPSAEEATPGVAASLSSAPSATRTPSQTSTATSTRTLTATLIPTPTEFLDGSASIWAAPVPQGARARLGKGSINRVAPSADGSMFGVAARSGVYLYSMETYAETLALATGSSPGSIVFSPDGRLFAAGMENGDITVWTTTDGKLLHSFRNREKIIGAAELAFSPDGKKLVSVSGGWIIHWDMDHMQSIKAVQFPFAACCGTIVLSPDGRFLAWVSDEGVVLRDTETGEAVKKILIESDIYASGAFSPDSRRIAVVSDSGKVEVWDVDGGEPMRIITTPRGRPSGLAFSQDGRLLAVGSMDTSPITVWDVETGEKKRIINSRLDDPGRVSFFDDGKVLITESASFIAFWDLSTGEILHALGGFASSVHQVTYSRDGTMLASGMYDGSINLWDPNTGARTRLLDGHEENITDIDFSPNGKYMASGSDDNLVLLWNAADGIVIKALTSQGIYYAPTGVAFSPNGTMLAVASSEGLVLWNLGSLSSTTLLSVLNYSGRGIAFSPDGSKLAYADAYNINIWDVQALRKISTIKVSPEKYGREPTDLAYTPDGKMLITSMDDGSVIWWNPETGEAVRQASLELDVRHNEWIISIALTPDGTRLAAMTNKDAVLLMDAAHGTVLRTLRGHGYLSENSINIRNGVAFAPDGKTFASGGSDGTVILWNVEE